MDYFALGPYFVAVVALTAAPGPIMAVLVARSIGRDVTGAAAFAAGLCAGDVIAVLAVLFGVGVWAQGQPEWLSLAKYAGVAYLMWLAVKMWNDRTGPTSGDAKKSGAFASAGAGLALCLGNPSTLLIYILLLPGLTPHGVENAEELALVMLVTFAAVGLVFFGTIILARQANRLLASPRAYGAMSRLTAGTIGLTSVWILVV